MRHLGLDVHQTFCEVAIREGGKTYSAGRVATDRETLELFAGSLDPTDEVCLEATGPAMEIARILEPHVARVVVANAQDVRAISHARVKSDRFDARTLAELLAAGMLDPVWVPGRPAVPAHLAHVAGRAAAVDRGDGLPLRPRPAGAALALAPGELGGDIGLVTSNHPDLRADVEAFGLPYEHVAVEKGAKREAEQQLAERIASCFDLVVLARYMQILSGDFLAELGMPVINLHHSFLPAFAGAGPYERAKERGVKLIGATAHYVTEELDAGPIIEQDVIHADSAADLERTGADIERAVLARAVRWHCEDRVLVDGNSTVVF